MPTSPVTGCSTASTARRTGPPETCKSCRPTRACRDIPAFLAAIFWLFGAGNFKAVVLTQILIDLGTCLIVADLARRLISERAAKIAFVLAALCPFLANYAAAELTETLEIFFTALALDCAVAALNRMQGAQGGMGGATLGRDRRGDCSLHLLRPDGGILLAAVLFYLALAAPKRANDLVRASLERSTDTKLEARHYDRRASLPGLLDHRRRICPGAARSLDNSQFPHSPSFPAAGSALCQRFDELVPRGFNRWVKTWIVDYVSVEEIYWNVPGDKIDPRNCRRGHSETRSKGIATLAVIADYNESPDMTPELDARFGNLAAESHSRPSDSLLRCCPCCASRTCGCVREPRFFLPTRAGGNSMTTRTHSAMAVGFGLLNLAYVAAALLALGGTFTARRKFVLPDCWSVSCCCARHFWERVETRNRATHWNAIPRFLCWHRDGCAGGARPRGSFVVLRRDIEKSRRQEQVKRLGWGESVMRKRVRTCSDKS
jgi:hypothetical protein